MAAKIATLRSQANGLPKTSPTPEPEAPGIYQLKHELSKMLENTMSNSCDDLTLLDITAGDEIANLLPRPMSSSCSSVTAQNETDGENTPVEHLEEEWYEEQRFDDEHYGEGYYEEETQCGEQQDRVEELYYVSNKVRDYHSLLLQASDALPTDANACREHCYYILASKRVPTAVRCGALYLLASLSNADGRRQEAKGFLEQALMLCDEMDRVNRQQGVAIGMVPQERVQALRDQLSSISDAIKCARVVVVSKHTTPSSSRASSQSHIEYGKRDGGLEVPGIIEDSLLSKGETDSGSSNTSFMTARQGQGEEREDGVPKTRIDRCHITELEFELTRAREEESRAKRRVHQAKRRREVIEERLIKTRKLWELQKV
ncbi:hypothetical protein Vi05172_g13200 [Venturia inaequalis]|nr:hypothetical protein Vi05172_g13200 [Venturia inaequalis]